MTRKKRRKLAAIAAKGTPCPACNGTGKYSPEDLQRLAQEVRHELAHRTSGLLVAPDGRPAQARVRL